jgi:glucose-1-phosphate adenylyltransferase
VIDRKVIIPDGLVVGEDADEDRKWFRRTDNGVVLITQSMLDKRATILGL